MPVRSLTWAIISLGLALSSCNADAQAIEECSAKINDKEYDSAFTVCQQAAEEENASAQFNLGIMFDNGEGTPKDAKQAVYWYTKAAEQGNATVQFYLGTRFDTGEGTPKDAKQAVYWYTKAAEQGDASAQFNLGNQFVKGEGTPKDNVMAYVWWNMAAAQGNEAAKKGRGTVEKKMTPNQIAEAQKLSREYYAKYVK